MAVGGAARPGVDGTIISAFFVLSLSVASYFLVSVEFFDGFQWATNACRDIVAPWAEASLAERGLVDELGRVGLETTTAEYAQTFVVAVGGAAAVVLYAFIGWLWFSVRGSVAALLRFADSIYFLGFAITLVSLTTSLTSFSANAIAIGGDPGAGQDIFAIIRGNAIALISTVFGIVLRNVITFSVKPFESEEDLAAKTLAFSSALSETTAKVAAFSQALVKLNSSIDSSPDQMRALVKELDEMRGLLSELTGTFTSTSTNVRNDTQALSDRVSQARETAAAATQGLEALRDRTAEAVSKQDDVNKLVDRFVEQLRELLSRLSDERLKA